MHDLKDEMKARKKQLQAIAGSLEEKAKMLPEGRLYRIPKREITYFYYRDPKQSGKFVYLKKDDQDLLRALMQKQYLHRLQKAAEEEISAIDLYLTHLPEVPAEELFETISKEEQKFVAPELESDELFLRHWLEEEYVSLRNETQFAAGTDDAVQDVNGLAQNECLTDRGEVVRSKSECMLANMLNKHNIPYKYEKPLLLNGFTVYPDFTILDIRNRRELFLEHLGRMDDAAYVEKAIKKINRYVFAGYPLGKRLLLTMETRLQPLNLPAAESMIMQALELSIE